MNGGVYMLCPYCDHELSEKDEICPNCGEYAKRETEEIDEEVVEIDETEEEDEIDETDEEDLLKEDNAFMVITRGVLSGLDFTWRALIRPGQSLSRDKTPILISTITVALLLLISTLMLYIYLSGQPLDGVNILYWLEMSAVLLLIFILTFGMIYTITKLLISREISTYRIIQDFSTLSVFTAVFLGLGVSALFFGLSEVFLLFMLIVFSLLVVNPVVLVTKYMMTYKAKVGLYFTNLLTILLVLTIFMLAFYVSLYDVVFKLIQIL